ncbi:MAG: hypothetical protein P8Z80_14915 [Pseudolabrys sp.]
MRKRLMIWGAVAAMSLVVAVGVSLVAGGNRTQTASSGDVAMPDIPMAAAPLPPEEFQAFKQASESFKRATDQTTAKLASVERNTVAARAETKRLADQVSKLTADSFRFTGRLSNIEKQIDGITGSITKVAQKAAVDAVAKAMPKKPGSSAFESPAPTIGRPATAPPKLSLLVPTAPKGAADTITTAAIKTPAGDAKPDVTSGSEAMAEAAVTTPDKSASRKTAERAPPSGELTASVGIQPKKGAIERRPHTALTPAAIAKAMADKALANKRMVEKDMARGKAPAAKVASVEPARHRPARHYSVSSRTSYGVDLGGATSVTVAKAQWAALKANFGPILIGMRPVAVRNHRFLTSGSFRLVAGHVRSWAAAKRVCALMARQQFACEPVKFEGDKVIWQ